MKNIKHLNICSKNMILYVIELTNNNVNLNSFNQINYQD